MGTEKLSKEVPIVNTGEFRKTLSVPALRRAARMSDPRRWR
jgi:hypothetical protein